jgi:hypothetical protein
MERNGSRDEEVEKVMGVVSVCGARSSSQSLVRDSGTASLKRQ